MEFDAFLRYWSLTLAVFVFYIFAIVVALLDVFADLAEAARKRRAERKAAAGDPNPLASRSIAQTIFPGPGQRLEGRRAWVARLVEDLVRSLTPRPPVRTLVLEDSKGHPVVHFSDGRRLETYRLDRDAVDAAMAGDGARLAEVTERLRGHLIADFLGREEARPPRTTELAREAKPAGAKAEAALPSAGAPVTAHAPAAPPGPAAVAGTPAADPESLSREERLAAARAKAEALRAARQAQKPPAE
jgi:hypothetical protein